MTLDDAHTKYPNAATFRFGDQRELMAEILTLVRSGRKTVTCDALAAFEARGDALPQVGRIDIALDWDGQPTVAIRTVEVLHIPFDEMSEDLVRDHAEFGNVADWRAGYREELTRSGHYHPQVMMLVERFELVEDFARASDV